MYGKAFHLPVELEHKALWELKMLNFEWKDASKSRMNKMNELDEFRIQAYEISEIDLISWHDKTAFVT